MRSRSRSSIKTMQATTGRGRSCSQVQHVIGEDAYRIEAWSIDELNCLEPWCQAVEAASNADLIVVAVRAEGQMPSGCWYLARYLVAATPCASWGVDCPAERAGSTGVSALSGPGISSRGCPEEPLGLLPARTTGRGQARQCAGAAFRGCHAVAGDASLCWSAEPAKHVSFRRRTQGK